VDHSWPSEVTVIGFKDGSFTRRNHHGIEESLNTNEGDISEERLVEEEVIGNIYENPELFKAV
jgi:hypothetical protein